jgi:DNA-binding Lrp family transcriptional regulator
MNALPVELLRLLAGGGIRSTAELARRLNVSETLIGMMTEDLVRRGYLAPLDPSCSSHCGGCNLSATCHVSGPPRPSILGLTSKGRQLATLP